MRRTSFWVPVFLAVVILAFPAFGAAQERSRPGSAGRQRRTPG